MKKIIKGMFFGVLFILVGLANVRAETIPDNLIDSLRLHPEIQHSVVAERIFFLLTQQHYRKITPDNKFSQAVFLRYLQWLDPARNLLLKSDVVQLQTKADTLLKELSEGDLNYAYFVYDFVTDKRIEFLEYSLELLNQKMDFTLNENINFNTKELSWLNTIDQLHEQWRKKVKYDELTLLLMDKTPEQVKSILTKRYQLALKRLDQSKSEDVFMTFMNAFAREIDPHTSYLSPRTNQQFNSEINLSLEGIGAALREDDDSIIVMSLVKGGPAEQSGLLKVGDKIIGVGQSEHSIEDVVGMRLDDVVDKIKGPKGSSVYLEILPKGNETPKEIKLVRDKIRLEDSAAKFTTKEVAHKKIGIITIPGFYMNLTQDVRAILQQAKQQQVQALVIDLRNNGGGALNEAIGLTGLFIPKGPVVQVKDNENNIVRYSSESEKAEYTGPLIVLINQYSASASEIFAAAMQDYGRAIIVGETSFGKGTVQTHRSLSSFYDLIYNPSWPELGAIQYTIQKFYRINGGSTQLKGVTPDITLPTLEREYGERFEDNPLPWDKINALSYKKLAQHRAELPKLKRLSQRRIAKDNDFIFIKQDIDKYAKERSLLYIISLNKMQREIEQKDQKELQLKRINIKRAEQGKPPVVDLDKYKEEHKKSENDEDPYLDETLNIALDYINILQD